MLAFVRENSKSAVHKRLVRAHVVLSVEVVIPTKRGECRFYRCKNLAKPRYIEFRDL